MTDIHEVDSVEVRDRLQGRTCAWCATYIPYSGRGRPPSYCSRSCRNRAWEVRTAERRLQRDIAAAAMRAEPVREVRTETITRTRTRVQTRLERRPPSTAKDWVEHLAALTGQLRKDGTLAPRHWDHRKLYHALMEALVVLGDAHPGGLDELAARR
ncbi:hypothetical protein EDD27_1495 [Nonomuraea polychroma]|uniref:Uncharacterized protein n=1 Tax=Nonomuraea polychroma TaxID=46176 RepID=A0A438M0Z7_9ACTN|nr:hypothetical protein [Nonomuraea polychroma]RVX39148.1 hypothetical protein EDD27_1495 [Nonomuraea polychroma]